MYLGKASIKFTATLLSAAILSACGSGGGGNENPTPTPQSSSSSVTSSDAPVSSSSTMVVSSSSIADSSSSVADSSSSTVDSSSSVQSSSSEASNSPVDCDTYSASTGGDLWKEKGCVTCHGDFADGVAPGGVLGTDPLDANQMSFSVNGMNTSTELHTFIAESMAVYATGGCDADCAANLAVYIKDMSDSPWCGDVTNSSDANSSSVASSSSDTSSDMSSSSDMTASSSSEGSSSSVVMSSSSNDMVMSSSSVAVSSSSDASSSSVAPEIVVEYTYPTPYAHLGGATSTKVVLKVKDPAGTVSKVTVGGIDLESSNGYWVTPSNAPLSVMATNGQEFATTVEVDGSELTANSLMLNNQGKEFVNKAGMTRVYSVRGLGIDEDDEVIYFTNPFDAQVLKYNSVTGESSVIYQGAAFNQLSEALYWPLAVDSAMDTVYVTADAFSFTDVGTDNYDVNLVKVQDAAQSALVTEFDVQDAAQSAKGLIIDANSVAATSATPVSGPVATAYSLNTGNIALLRWYLAGTIEGRAQSLNVEQGTNAKLTPEFGLAALAAKPNFADGSILVAREYGTAEFRGKAALVEVTSADDGLGTITAEAKLLTELNGVVKPTALLYNRAGTHVYIADADRIWLMDMSDYSKALVTSSSNLSPGVKGVGPQLGGKITAMALHPTMDYLYLAADNGGLMMVDLATGNRITVVK